MNNTKRRVSCPQLTKLTLILTLLLGWGSDVWGDAKNLPYSYGFENNNLTSEGWTMNCGGSTGIYNSSSYSYNSTYSFRFYGTTDTQYLFSPELANSDTGIDVSFYYNSFTQYSSRTFNVGYSTTDTEISSFVWLKDDISYTANGWFQFNESFPTGTKYIAIRHTAISQYQPFYIDDFSVSVSTSYKTPTDFILDSFSSNSATFSWTAGNEETNWKFAYSTDEDFVPNTETATNITENPYTLGGLTEGTTYYACICADYGDDHYSEWTPKVTFTPNNEVEITKYDGETASYNIPISSSNVNNNTALTQTQFIIPSSDLTSIQNRQITKLTFYASSNSVTWGAATFEVYLKETSNTSYSTSEKKFESWGTCVYNNQGLSTNSTNGQMEITLNTPFNYTTGNLMIGFKQLTKGTKPSTTYWYSTQPYSNNAIFSYGTYVGVLSYSPKVTILTVSSNTDPVKMGENGFTTYASSRKLDLTEANLPSGLKAYKAESVSGNIVRFTEIDQTVSANTGILLKGTANTTYNIPVAESGTAPEGNLLKVNTTGSTFTVDGDYTYFGMKKATSSSDQLTFATFTPSTVAIPANKAYLEVLTSSLPAEGRTLTCVFDDEETTAIKNVERETLNMERCFDLQGRRVAQPTKGLYIVNGKKYVVK